MSLDSKEIKNIYVATTTIIIVVILLLALAAYKSETNYDNNRLIAIKSSRGLIKMNADALTDHLSTIHADLSRHSKYERVDQAEAAALLDHIKTFINKNPQTQEIHKCEKKAKILSDILNGPQDADDKDDNDDNDEDDLDTFDQLLLHIEAVIKMLKHDICDCGLLDVLLLEKLATKLDNGATVDNYDNSVLFNDPDLEGELSTELVARADAYSLPKLPPFASQINQLEGFSVESQIRGAPVVGSCKLQGPQHMRNAQQRSQLFRDNVKKMGIKHYMDEDLLFTPTYDSMAL